MGQPIENGVSPDASDIGSRATILPTIQEGAPGHHSIVRSIVSLGLIFIDKSKLSQGAADLILQCVTESSMVVIAIKRPYCRQLV